MSALLSAEDLRFLDIITYPEIQIEENCFTFITGESGCGKSTFLKLLNATVLPSAGQVCYRGREVGELEVIEYRRKVLLATQEVFLLEGTIRENFDFYYESRDEERIEEERLRTMLHICLAEFSPDTRCGVLSGGERQRVFLAICLSFAPEVLLLDEPTSALDDWTARRLLSNLKTYCKEHRITPIAVCHNAQIVEEFADRVIEFKRGTR